MYLSLIDAVSKIVKTYGVDILSDPKFWQVLSDSYSFGNEYALKTYSKVVWLLVIFLNLLLLRETQRKPKPKLLI